MKKVNIYFKFFMKVAQILTCESLDDIDKLNCIRLQYRAIAFPEVARSKYEDDLLARIV